MSEPHSKVEFRRLMFTGEFSTPAAEAGLAGVRINHTREEHAALTLTVVCPARHSGREGTPSGHCWQGIAVLQPHCSVLSESLAPDTLMLGVTGSGDRPLAHKSQSTSVVSDWDDPW